jgi:hypothetical protein
MNWRWAIVLSGVVVVHLGAQAPRDVPRLAAPGTASITGRIVDDSGAPVRNGMVTLGRVGIEDNRFVSTDSEGRYRLTELPAGTYEVLINKPPFIRMQYGAPKPGMPGTPIAIVEGQQFEAETMTLTRGGVIAGRLVDRSSRPIALSSVTATQFFVDRGVRIQRFQTPGASGTAQTNGHGDYRIYGLLPGEYVVTAVPATVPRREMTSAEQAWLRQPSADLPPQGREYVLSSSFFPGVADPALASVIRLRPGEERLGVDFPFDPVPVSRIAGKVIGADGKPVGGTAVTLSAARPIEFAGGGFSQRATTATDGTFSYPAIAAGEYVLESSGAMVRIPISEAAQRLTPTEFGFTSVRASGQDLTSVVIQLQPTVTVAGRFEVSGSDAGWGTKAVTLVGLPMASKSRGNLVQGSPGLQRNSDGTFKIVGIVPGSYRVWMTVPAGTDRKPWAVRSVMVNGIDAMDNPIEIGPGRNDSGWVVTVTDTPATLSGTITNTSEQPQQLYVFAFSTNRSDWVSVGRRTGYARSNEKGVYTINGLPPGEYFVCALTELDMELRYTPEYLEQLPTSLRITLGEGEKKQQNLQIAR